MSMDKKREAYKKTEARMEEKFSEFIGISDYIFHHPELGCEEYQSAEFLCSYLEKEGFLVTVPMKDIPTAFTAEYRPEGLKKNYRTVSFLAEYDALPGFGEDGGPGHACGHNWIAAAMCGCAVSLKAAADELNCVVKVLGTPAEETLGAKYDMIEAGLFDDTDVAFQAHLDEFNSLETLSLAMNSLEFSFFGKPAHAAQNPEKGINALDAVISMYNNINALRQHIPDSDRIHGIITEGGKAANIVPDFAQCRISFRSKTKSGVQQLRKKIIHIAEGASMATGASMEYRDYENASDDMINVKALCSICQKHFESLGYTDFISEEEYYGSGSSDIGNVSYMCPTVYLEISPKEGGPVIVHDRSAMDRVNAGPAMETMRTVITAYTRAAVDICLDNGLYEEIVKEHKQRITD